jgi:rhamnopyranosyl-N-acetylglucosaminyl-diphospho-decaprenol beta-1,3/1,4-galactofuranosyltransferase
MIDTRKSSVVAVVPTYNRRVLVTECIKAILTQTNPVVQVVVVDNASTDGTEEFLGEHGLLDDERVDFLRTAVNSGSAGGFSGGLQRALSHDPDWIWLIDNDALPSPSALEKLLLAGTSREPDRVALTSYQLQLEGSPITYWLPRNVFDALRFGIGCSYVEAAPGDESVIAVDWFPFVSALIPAAAVEAVGPPLADLFYYGEDMEYSLRLRAAGFAAYLVPGSVVDHDKPRIGGSDAPGWRRYYVYRNTLYVIRTQGRQIGVGARIAALTRLTAGAMFWMARDLLKGNRRRAALTLRGVRDGYLGRIGATVRPGSSD